MAINRFQVIMKSDTLLPRDNAVNTLYYEVNFPDTHGGVMDDIALCYTANLLTYINAGFTGLEIKAYDDGPGPPKEVRSYAAQFSGGGGPTEVALCLSYSAVDNAAGAKRYRGRIYLPIVQLGLRPNDALINGLLAFGGALGVVGNLGNTTWMMRSATGTGTALNPVPVYRKIESISVDNEWDTQRRRGMRATVRSRQDVQ
jgi:hypothetical protein